MSEGKENLFGLVVLVRERRDERGGGEGGAGKMRVM